MIELEEQEGGVSRIKETVNWNLQGTRAPDRDILPGFLLISSKVGP